MHKIILAILVLILTNADVTAQGNDCLERQLAKEGKWTKLKETVKSSPADLAIQRKFFNALHNPLQQAYQPKGVDAAYSGSFQPPKYGQPVAFYWYTLFAERYFCEGDALVLNKFDINSMFTVEFNYVSFLEIYDTTASDNALGFRPLREGIPVEIRPGIWQFNDQRTSLGAGAEGITKLWLISYDAQLPWNFVTRREFLLKRKRYLLREMAAEAPRFKEQLNSWEQQKKYKEQEWKSEPSKLANYMSGTHNPAIERVQASYKKLMQEYEKGIAVIDEQLAAPAEELNKTAIVIKSTKNNFDYSFTDKMEPFAELLTKPNPAYFKKGFSAAVPQMITVSIKFDPKNAVTAAFGREMEKNLRLDYLKSFIGKNSPPAQPGNKTAAINSSPHTDKPVVTSTTQAAATTPIGTKTGSTATSQLTANKATAATTSKIAPGKSASLSGTLGAPVGIAVTLSYNGGNDISIKTTTEGNNLYGTTAVKFTSPIKEGTEYSVALKKIPANMKGVIYHGKGTAPAAVDKIKAGIDFTHELITRSTNDKTFSTFYESFAPAIGGYKGDEGRYVVFVSNSKNFEGSTGKFRQVFWRDRNTGITKLISASATGEQANGDCGEPSISADGKTVVFESRATNLVPGDNNNFKDIFLWRAATNTVELISSARNGGFADAESFDASISGNGNFVSFTSSAGNVAATPKGRSLANIFVRDIAAGKTEMLSIDPTQKAGGNGYKSSISFDGTRISFCSPTSTLVANDNNGLWDIFVWQKGTPHLKRVSLTHDGKERNGGSESASRQVASALSGNGQMLAFATTASNMVPGDNNNFQDVFVVDVESGKVQVASFANDGAASNGDSPIEQGERIAISYDGTWVAFPTKATNLGTAASNIILHNTITGKKSAASDVKGSYVGRPSISYGGGYILFGKSANLDDRFSSSGIFAFFTGNGPCRDCK